MSDTDISKELVQKAAAGDRAAFEVLYQETCRSVYFTCLNILKDEQEAQDVAQDVYLTALEKLDTLKDMDRFRPWLYRIAANKSIKRLRKKQPILPGDEQLQDMETEENENFLPEEYALHADKRAMVLDITREVCTDVQYQTILLYYFNGLSVAEIAEIMECQEGNVKKRMSIARAKIRDGVLQYEKKSGDKLYSFAVIPFLTMLFTAQAKDMQIAPILLRFPDARHKSAAAASSAKTGGRILLKGIQLKIAAVLAVVAVVGGVAAAVVITNQNGKEVSVGVQEGSTTDVADVENAEGMDTSAETDISETEADEVVLQEGTGITSESESSIEHETAERTAQESGTDEKATTEETEPTEGSEIAETANEETPKPTAESEQQYTYTDMSATMYATQTVNIRTLPSIDGEKVGSLSTNQEITITGQCNETSWYRFEYNGETVYVSNSYVSDTKIEVAATDPAANPDTAPVQSVSSIPNASDYPVGVWVNMDGWAFKVSSDWKRPEDAYGVGFHLGDGSVKWCWINDDNSEAANNAIKQFVVVNCCGHNEPTHGGTKPLWDEANKTYYFP